MAHEFKTVFVTGIQLVTSATSVGSAIPIDSSGGIPRFIRIAATAPAAVRIGAGPQSALVTDLQVQPGDAVVISTNGATHIAARQVSGPGIVQVSPLENLA
jgi:hypothetical protein